MGYSKSWWVLAGGMMSAAEPTAQAAQLPWEQNPPPRLVEDRFRLEVDLFAARASTRLRIDPSPQQQGTTVSAEDDLGLQETKWLPHVELTLFPGRDHLVRLSTFSMKRNGSVILERQVVFEDNTYNIGERVDSVLDLTMVGLTYGYRLLHAEAYDLAVTLGMHIASVDANAVVPARVIRESDSGVAPLPLIGLEGRADLTRRWSLSARVQYLKANISDVEGEMMDLRAGTQWRFNPHLALGLEYRAFKIQVESAANDTPGLVDMKFTGPQLTISGSL